MFANPTQEHRNLIPLGRLGQPEEVAQVVELLLTNAYMTNKVRGHQIPLQMSYALAR